jgi:hypothetical protein
MSCAERSYGPQSVQPNAADDWLTADRGPITDRKTGQGRSVPLRLKRGDGETDSGSGNHRYSYNLSTMLVVTAE